MLVAVGLSGGVDSCVSALRLREAGNDVVGISMKLWRGAYRGGDHAGCFGAREERNLAAAAAFARDHGIAHRVFDVSEAYDRTIVSYFRDTYLGGATPNPCVFCNPLMKFGLLPRLAKEGGLSFDRFATGHYARIVRRGTRLAVAAARDRSKDQSYFLYRLSQDQLARQMFPLGDCLKSDVREYARAHGLEASERPDSQDFYTGDVDELLGATARPGDIVDADGNVLGRHDGFWHYTIGQRKGLGIGGAGEPWYVSALDAERNRVVVSRHDRMVRTGFAVEDLVWSGASPTDGPFPCRVKVRSAAKSPVPAILHRGVCSLQEGIAGVAPGQSAVFYAPEADEILVGGVISR